MTAHLQLNRKIISQCWYNHFTSTSKTDKTNLEQNGTHNDPNIKRKEQNKVVHIAAARERERERERGKELNKSGQNQPKGIIYVDLQ